MYSLFIDTLSSPAFICLFDIDKSIKDSISWVARHAEFDTLTESIDTVINRNNLEYNQIKEIICIVWPGGFTWIRVTTLVANTLGYSFWIPLHPITAREFFKDQICPLPWILPLTKTEVILWEKSEQLLPTIVKINTLYNICAYSSNHSDPILGEDIPYNQANNYELFLKNFTQPEKVSLLQPLYARDPNILIKK